MGGAMPYSRFRARNGLIWRPPKPGVPYPPREVAARTQLNVYGVLGDLNRMEQDYLGLSPQPRAVLDGGGFTFTDYGVINEVATRSNTPPRVCRDVLAAFFDYPHPYPEAPRD